MSLVKRHFYHNLIRNTIVSFGQLFSGMEIRNVSADGSVEKIINVPISYFPKEKWFVRRTDDPSLNKPISIDLPRIAFEITGYRYDPARKVGQQNDYILGQDTNGKPVRIGSPVPYELEISLSTFTGTQDEALQLLEQILPYFSPAVYIDIEMVPEFKLRQKIPVILDSIQTQNNYDGLVQDEQLIIQTFNFIAKINLIGPIDTSEVIKKAIVNEIYFGSENTYTATVDPFGANSDGAFKIIETFTP